MSNSAVMEKSRRGRKPLSFSGFRSFDKARDFARTLGLKSVQDWNDWCKGNDRPEDIPSAPGLVYRNSGWVGMPDFLGYEPSGRGRPLGSKNKDRVLEVVPVELPVDSDSNTITDETATCALTPDEDRALEQSLNQSNTDGNEVTSTELVKVA